jgi:hypothetical protein
VTVLDSGLQAPVGQRLLTTRDLIADKDLFLANYTDGLPDVKPRSHKFPTSNA